MAYKNYNDQLKCQREHYKHNKQKYLDRNKRRKRNLKKFVNGFKKECFICREDDIVCLQFHHTKEKEICISKMVINGYGKEKILKEIRKCKVVCANCHFKLHRKK